MQSLLQTATTRISRDLGYYATVRGENHWYMISIEPMFQPLSLSDIALILASRATRVTESGSYENKYHALVIDLLLGVSSGGLRSMGLVW